MPEHQHMYVSSPAEDPVLQEEISDGHGQHHDGLEEVVDGEVSEVQVGGVLV